jgi:UDP-MurNAc hydroxylase
MRITFLGHAGLFIETQQGSILCDPWFNPAFFASWFPYPSNGHLDVSRFEHPTYLYVSHFHDDHFDEHYLREHVSKDATVLLPDYPVDLLERSLRDLGFTRFLRTANGVPFEHDGLRFEILALVAPTDGSIGDSSLMVDDGETRIFDQNDSKPTAIERITSFGKFHAHFVQYSGAVWYPVVYQFPPQMMAALGAKKRKNHLARALSYAEQVGASHIFPSAGPPCFLDDALYDYNDFDRDPTNPFPDATVFLEYLREHGHENGHLIIPGSVITLQGDECSIEQPLPEAGLRALFADKRTYLEAYRREQRPVIERAMASLPRGRYDIVAELRAWLEPLLAMADHISVGINGRVLLDCGEQQPVIDFQSRTVYPWHGEECEYIYHIDPALVESCIERHEVDWVNDLFLSFRFSAERKGPYNEYIYIFFRCLSPERLIYAEGYLSEKTSDDQFWEADGYRLQRRCPHMKADLTRFGTIENGLLTCALHGWQFDLETGACLTSNDRRLFVQRLTGGSPSPEQEEEMLAHLKRQTARQALAACQHCWYMPALRREAQEARAQKDRAAR